MSGDGEEQKTPVEQRFERARRMRNYALAGLLLFLVVLFFVMTIVRLRSYYAG